MLFFKCFQAFLKWLLTCIVVLLHRITPSSVDHVWNCWVWTNSIRVIGMILIYPETLDGRVVIFSNVSLLHYWHISSQKQCESHHPLLHCGHVHPCAGNRVIALQHFEWSKTTPDTSVTPWFISVADWKHLLALPWDYSASRKWTGRTPAWPTAVNSNAFFSERREWNRQRMQSWMDSLFRPFSHFPLILSGDPWQQHAFRCGARLSRQFHINLHFNHAILGLRISALK